MTSTPSGKPSSAYYVQSILAFGIALGVVIVGEIYVPAPHWTRAFLALGTVFLVSASFTLAKCIRDQQETESVVSRIDQARLERLLAEFDPYRFASNPSPNGTNGTNGGPANGPTAGPVPPPPVFHA